MPRFLTFKGLDLICKELNRELLMPEEKEHFTEGFAKMNIQVIPALPVMGLRKIYFIEGMEVGGAITFLEFTKDADVTLTC